MSTEPKAKTKKKKSASRSLSGATTATAPRAEPNQAANTNKLIVVAAIAVAAGGAGGWFLRDSRQTPGVEAQPDDATAAAAGSAGPCGEWAKAVCTGAGDSSEACGQANTAAGLLPAAACVQAMKDVPGTLERAKSARGACETLVGRLCKDLGPETETCKMVQERTTSIPVKDCTEMMGDYERVLGGLKEMEKQNAPIDPAMVQKQRAGDGPSFGPADAKVAVVEYSDFECPFCGQAAQTVTKLKKKYGTLVRFVFRQYPLPNHPNATLAAEASLAAHAQGKFWQLHDVMFQNQRALTRADLEGYAEKAGLDMKKFKEALDKHTYGDPVQADIKLGEEIGISGTPTMIVNTQRVQNPTDFESISKAIDKELAAAGVAVPPSDPEPEEGEEGDDHEGHGHEGHGHPPPAPAPAPAPKAPAPAPAPAPKK